MENKRQIFKYAVRVFEPKDITDLEALATELVYEGESVSTISSAVAEAKKWARTFLKKDNVIPGLFNYIEYTGSELPVYSAMRNIVKITQYRVGNAYIEIDQILISEYIPK